jgi:hypothetical protein
MRRSEVGQLIEVVLLALMLAALTVVYQFP